MPRFRADMGFVPLVFVVALAAALSSWAADTLDLPESRARAARAETPAAGVHRLDAEALRRFATLEDAVASLPGFRVRRQGGLGGYSELSFRGARASRVDVYVDGIRLNHDGDAAPDLSKWPSLWFSSLEARAGLDPSGAGPGALARLDLSTRSAGRAEAHARAGSFGAGEVAAAASGGAGAGWTLVAGAEAQAARNDYSYFNDNGTAFNTDDDAVRLLDNNAYGGRGLRLTARRDEADGAHALSVLWLESRKEYPGLFEGSSSAYTLRSDWLAAWRTERRAEPFAWEAGAQARRLWDSYRDPGQSLGTFSAEQARVSRAVETDAAARAPVGTIAATPLVLRADLRLRAEDVAPTVTPHSRDMASPAARRYEGQAGARLETRELFGAPALSASVEARGARARFEADGVRPFPDAPAGEPVTRTYAPVALRAAAEWRTGAGAFGATVRREPRPPSSGELLGDNHGVRHNLALREEEARAFALSHTLVNAGWSLATSLFLIDYADPLRLGAHGGSPFLRHENGPDYRARGAEFSGGTQRKFVEGSFSVTLQEAVIREGLHKGNRPAYHSGVEAHAELFLKPSAGTRAGPLLDYRGAYYPGDANIPAALRGAEWEWGAHASRARGPLRAALDARNLGGRNYRDFVHSPRSGRSWSITLSLNL